MCGVHPFQSRTMPSIENEASSYIGNFNRVDRLMRSDPSYTLLPCEAHKQEIPDLSGAFTNIQF